MGLPTPITSVPVCERRMRRGRMRWSSPRIAPPRSTAWCAKWPPVPPNSFRSRRVTNLARTLDGLKERGIWVVGTDGEADQSLYAADLKRPLALVLGAEGSGMRRLTRDKCDFLVRIPMAGHMQSLNVSVAAGIALFEALAPTDG